MHPRLRYVTGGLLGFALPLAFAACSHTTAAGGPPPAAPVVVGPVQQRDITLTTDWVATLQGYVNANIQPEVGGYLIRQDYREGDVVKQDQVLFEIDPRPFQAALDQARGQLAQAQAQVVQAQAALHNNDLNVERDTPEAAAHAIAQSQLQNDTQARLGSEAAVAAAQATVKADQAAVEQAQLNLGFTQVRSLIDGVAGIATVQIGNLVTPQTTLTSVSQLDPVKAYFPISAQDYMASATRANGAQDLLAAGAPPLHFVLADGSVYAHPGHLLFADRAVDPSTDTIEMVAAFPNPGNLLRPGQTGRVRAVTQIEHGALVVPQSAVSQLQGNNQVAVVGPDDTVTLQTVQLGPTSGQDWVVTSGLKAGETVVVQGVSKVRDGSRVRPVPASSAPPAAAGGGQ